VDRQRKIVYSTEYDLIGKYEPGNPDVEEALGGRDVTSIHYEKRSPEHWYGNWLVETYYPLREGAGNYWMLGNIYGVIQITQDVTDQYFSVQRSIFVVILVAAGLMGFSFIMLTLIVRRGERILLERARDQKRLEEQLQQSEKLASIGQMVATLAHEIRNPLGIIRSSAEVLVKKVNPDPSRVQKLCGIIVEEARRLSEILTDFLDFAKPRSPASRSIDVRDVISRVRNNLDQQIRSKNINWIEESMNGEVPVTADPDLLYQAFLNVAINAFEAMDEGGAFAVSVEREGSEVRVSFSDTGHGIRDEDLSKIFTPFFTTHEMGTGLGLSVVHNIITAHGGEIAVESHPGRGAIFTIILPAGSASREKREISNKVQS
jgi:signal transduction histidine kinase